MHFKNYCLLSQLKFNLNPIRLDPEPTEQKQSHPQSALIHRSIKHFQLFFLHLNSLASENPRPSFPGKNLSNSFSLIATCGYF